MKTRTTFILSLTVIITIAAGSAFGFSGGNGTAANPFQIATKQDLLELAVPSPNYGECFILTADIDMQGQVFTTAIIAPDTVSGNYSFEGTAFTGTFDGNGHKITHFTINGGSNWYLGLFGYISGGSVKNLGLENCSVSGNELVGGLVGSNSGSISNCYSTGTVSGKYDVGGLVGYNSGSISNCYSTGAVSSDSNSQAVGGLVGGNWGNISNCYSMGSVSGGPGSEFVGGLVGGNGGYSGGSISNCYSTGAVSGGSNSWYVGGLVGINDGSISNCYSTGSVSSLTDVGGLVGGNWGNISNCYSMGSVSGSESPFGGLVGSNSGNISSSFWDTQTSGQTTSAGGTGMTTAEMKTLSTFTSAGWDFVEIWGIEENQTYPYLRTEPAGDLNHDKKVDFKDFAILAENWLSSE
jgi:hypothetical protein